MNHELKLGLAALVVAGLTSGCISRECTDDERESAGLEADEDCRRLVSLETFFSEDSETLEVDWEPGTDIELDGAFAEILVEGGNADSLAVTFRRQVDLASDREDDVVARTLELLEVDVAERGGVIEVTSDRGDSAAALGASVVVRLPENFDAELTLRQGRDDLRGNILVDELFDATVLIARGAGIRNAIEVGDPSRLRAAQVNTGHDIRTGPFGSSEIDEVILNSSNGNIETAFVRAPSEGSRIYARGRAELLLEDSIDGVLQITARDNDVVGLPAACSPRTSLQVPTWVCGDGSEFLSFDVRAEQVAVEFDDI